MIGGRFVAETDAVLECYMEERITSVSAHGFHAGFERAAELAKENEMDVRLHLNFSEGFTDGRCPRRLGDNQERIVRFLRRNSTRNSSTTRLCEEHFFIRTLRRWKSSSVYLANSRHTSTGITTCTFVPISS
jgi:hypothetical protein